MTNEMTTATAATVKAAEATWNAAHALWMTAKRARRVAFMTDDPGLIYFDRELDDAEIEMRVAHAAWVGIEQDVRYAKFAAAADKKYRWSTDMWTSGE